LSKDVNWSLEIVIDIENSLLSICQIKVLSNWWIVNADSKLPLSLAFCNIFAFNSCKAVGESSVRVEQLAKLFASINWFESSFGWRSVLQEKVAVDGSWSHRLLSSASEFSPLFVQQSRFLPDWWI
jgi:hypothetical protein